MRRASNRRPGWALVWVILTIAIIAALFATAAPSLVSLDDRIRAQSAANQLHAIGVGFRAFSDSVKSFPGKVSQLTNAIATSDFNSCHGTMTGGEVNRWPKSSPYVAFYTAPGGTWTDIGRIRDSVPVRTDPTSDPPVFIELPGVKGEMAAMLDLLVDHGTGDTVTYSPVVNDTTTIRYRVITSGNNNQC